MRPPEASDGAGVRETRRMERMLFCRLLDLDEPVMTDKMVEFLSGDEACESLVAFITRIPEGDVGESSPRASSGEMQGKIRRPQIGDEVTQELKRSFRATILLANGEPSEAHREMMQRKARVLARALMKVFWPEASGSLHHACYLLDFLLRNHADEMLDGLLEDQGFLEENLARMLEWVEYSPVSDFLLKLLDSPSTSGVISNVKMSAGTRWRLYAGLANWRLLLRLGERISHPRASEAHVSACSDLLMEVVDRLAADGNGEMLLQPLGHCRELLDGLASAAVNEGQSMTTRVDNARTLLTILRKAANDDVLVVNPQAITCESQAPTNSVPNRLRSVRDRLYKFVRKWLPEFCAALMSHDGSAIGAGENTGLSKSPFTSLRYVLVGILSEMANADARHLDSIPRELWLTLCRWFFVYPDNNLYHGLFYKLLYRALRANHVSGLETMFSHGRLVDQLLEAYMRGKKSAGNRGFVTQLLNAMRLQAETLAPSAFLRSFLSSHEGWGAALPVLREDTLRQQRVGLGFEVPTEHLGAQPKLLSFDDDVGIDLGSRYARTLGFEDDMAWLGDESLDEGAPGRRKKCKEEEKGTTTDRGKEKSRRKKGKAKDREREKEKEKQRRKQKKTKEKSERRGGRERSRDGCEDVQGGAEGSNQDRD